jgi:hypothetical protein
VKRRLLNALTTLALLLSLATAVLWVRSYLWTDRIFWQTAQSLRWAQSRRGDVLTQFEPASTDDPRTFGFESQRYGVPGTPRRGYDLRGVSFPSPPNVIELHQFAGFWYCTLGGPSGVWVTAIAIPYWSLLTLCLLLPALRGWQMLRTRKRRNKKLCPTCGYDLRATPDRCPECGTLTK